jgi:hypothetical protein
MVQLPAVAEQLEAPSGGGGSYFLSRSCYVVWPKLWMKFMFSPTPWHPTLLVWSSRCMLLTKPFVAQWSPFPSLNLPSYQVFLHTHPVSLLTLQSPMKYSITTSLASVLIHNTQPTKCTVFFLKCLHHNTEHPCKFQYTRDHHQGKGPNNTA